ncbi:beta-lactamase-like protein [Nitzschia inconspicua]|uniref:Beta-lactamase-like protein n=1 Tax=Nitzschia inconspicua TaxID=303405 RepID=A0A9K3KPG0_9STRA|nr:beta-lactamase-like protein [Nitzschia inconspicua]
MRTLSRRIPIRNRGYTLASQTCGPLACNMYALVCDTSKEAVVVDASTTNPSEFQAFQQFLTEQHGAHLKHILLTHAHPDHIIGITETMRKWPEASLHVHPMEEENYSTAYEFGLQLGMPMPHERLPRPTDELREGQIIRVGDSIELTVVHTPGHSPGHVAFVDRRVMTDFIEQSSDSASSRSGSKNFKNDASDSAGNVLLLGDLLFRGSVGRTDLHNASMEDLLASLRRLYESFHDDSIVLSGHTTPTFLQRERQSNPFVDLALKRPREWYEEYKEHHEWVDLDR